ncbi:MAG: hypothetical protein LBP50_11160 [Tannerella sp.]|nr:hypothetical protein [Tannerella sp.]
MSALLLMFFISHLANTALFVHTHIVDGQYVTHSHPYQGTRDNPGHGHTPAQFQTIAHLLHSWSFAVSTLVFTCFLAGKRILRNPAVPCFGNGIRLFSYSLRAPPLY